MGSFTVLTTLPRSSDEGQLEGIRKRGDRWAKAWTKRQEQKSDTQKNLDRRLLDEIGCKHELIIIWGRKPPNPRLHIIEELLNMGAMIDHTVVKNAIS